MTAYDRFLRDLESWLADSAIETAPTGLHAAIIQRVGRSRQRPRWSVALRGETYGPSVGSIHRPAVRLAAALVVGAVALSLVVAAIAGVFRTTPTDPLAQNGAIVYSVFEDKDRAGQTSLTYQMNADGSDNRLIAAGTCPTHSSDGSTLAYRSSWSGTDLLVGPADGSTPRTMPMTLDFFYRDLSYALSPDGTQVAWFKLIEAFSFPTPDGGSEGGTARNELWLTPVGGGPGTRLVAGASIPNESYWMPTWSPDGRTIAFEGRIAVGPAGGRSHRSAVYAVDVDGSTVRTITTRPLIAYDAFGLSWSPDGRHLAYVGLPGGSAIPAGTDADAPVGDPPTDLFVIGVDGTGDRNVTQTPDFESGPSWSPDGTRLVYLGSPTGTGYRLMMRRMVGPAPAAPAVQGPASESFTWSPDASMLLWVQSPTIGSIDAEFREQPRIVVDVSLFPQADPLHPATYSIESCPPSWQALEP